MRSADRTNTLWSLVGASSAEGRRARRRLAAGAALAALMSGLLTAIGLWIVVVGLAAFVLIAAGGAAAARAVPHCWPGIRLRALRIAAAIIRGSTIASDEIRSRLSAVRRHASSLLAWLRVQCPRLVKVSADRVVPACRDLAKSVSRTTRPIDLQRAALRINASGTRHRRHGAHARAVELHRRALEILQGLDDRRAVALTQNNLALALSHIGDDSAATMLFEEAAATLRELGEEQHEGHIIANLGLAHRRYGRHEQSETVLKLALTKLTPASRAYEKVEAELRRAS